MTSQIQFPKKVGLASLFHALTVLRLAEICPVVLAMKNFYEFLLIRYHLPFENVGNLHLNNTWNPFIQECFLLSLFEIDSLVLGKKIFLNFVNLYFHNFVMISPWERTYTPYLNKPKSLSPKNDLYYVWLKLAKWLWRRWKCDHFRDRRTTDDRPSEMLTWAES